jgi:hypothetical protein
MLKFDFSDFEKMADKLDVAAKQLPFAISKAMNQSAFATRGELIDEWSSHLTVRNQNFARVALTVETSKKSDLTVSITDKRVDGRGNMALHADGGTRTGQGGDMAIPVGG